MPQTKKPSHRKRRKLTRKFNETRLGYYLEHAAPLEYRLILEVSGAHAPKIDVIEAVIYASLNPYFKTPKFHNALREYRKYNIHPPRPVKPTVLRELYFIRYRKELVKKYNESL